MYAATRTISDGYVYYQIGDGSQDDLARLAGGGIVHAYIVRGEPDEYPMGQSDGYADETPVLAEGWYDASDQDETADEFADRLFEEARDAGE